MICITKINAYNNTKVIVSPSNEPSLSEAATADSEEISQREIYDTQMTPLLDLPVSIILHV